MQPTGGTVYFVGAGATRADFADIPLMDDLLDQILRSESTHEILLSFLSDLFGPKCLESAADPHARPRIDDVFTVIDASLSGRAPFPGGKSPERLVEVRRHLIAAIGRVIAKTTGEGRGRIAIKFARALPDRSSSVISTNYDIVMDNALLERKPGNVNYGVPIREAVFQSEGLPRGRFDEIHHFKPLPESQATIKTGNISLLKLNGSLNWLYCPRCDELDITLLQGTGALTILDELELGRCSRQGCTSPYQTLLVGPSLGQRYEHRVLGDIWARAERALEKASRLVVIGYSMPEADYLVRAMMARTFAHRSQDVTVVTLVNTALDRHLVEQRFRRLFAECRFELDGFAGFVRRLTGEF
ncbi:MAG: hypothetical protein DMH00_08200 [Acidobacteria bacterium]|nr:MAG: hypothetical protein DMH00_08200 [Acidobacteriota bacterium]